MQNVFAGQDGNVGRNHFGENVFASDALDDTGVYKLNREAVSIEVFDDCSIEA